MTTKEQVLNILNNNNGAYISGQEIADKIFVTRAAVWKAIKSLEKDGHIIEAVTNKGYRLKKNLDTINPSYIQKSLSKKWSRTKVLYFDEIDSTNDEAKRQAEGSTNDLIIISNKQTNGRGRRGRSFHSPANTGLYFSVLLHTNCFSEKLAGITGIAASSTAKAIDDVIFNGIDTTGIKWVNDIFINGKKVAGILSEACNYMEDESSNFIIIGFGINVFEPEDGFPKDIKKTAAAVLSKESDYYKDNNNLSSLRNNLIVSILNNLLEFIDNKNESLKIYKNKSILIGNYVKINSFANTNDKDKKRYARVTGINSKYHLMIQYEDGKKDELSSGEVSVVKY